MKRRPLGGVLVFTGFMASVFSEQTRVATRPSIETQEYRHPYVLRGLKDLMMGGIDAAKTDGTIKRLSMKWFGFDVTP
ncbi:hypothetical protein [Ochrobactrum sp. EDr1-4]|uniref:hypothetical protein n=1 Tax=Ochrobactrum sp. EDr1-4 TaxID=3368622 RepID=UPI003BA081FC